MAKQEKEERPHRPRLTEEEYNLIQDFRGVKKVALKSQVPIEDIDFYWRKTKKHSVKIKNRFYKHREDQTRADIDFTGVFDNYVEPVYVEPKKKLEAEFDRLVYTDVHIGMNPNPDGFALYGGKWDKEEIMNRLDIMCDHVVAKQKSNILYIDELGDFMDGFNQQTVRGGHDLPQNMTNQEAYDVGVLFKTKMIDKLLKKFDKIICHNICDDNHAGDFGYMVNKAFKNYIELKYPKNVEIINIRKFIDYYKVGRNTFMLTHGKDGKNLKFGFKPKLDDKQITKIKNLIDEHYLAEPNVTIEFSKGDSHQYLFDNSSSDMFNYYNYPAFSPSSNWVQTNFQKGISGFVSFNYFQDGSKEINEHLFDWKS